jgi:hypothetical protein
MSEMISLNMDISFAESTSNTLERDTVMSINFLYYF